MLGSVLLDSSVWEQAKLLSEQDFSLEANQLIFRRMGDLAESRRPIATDGLTRRENGDTLARRRYLHSKQKVRGGWPKKLIRIDGKVVDAFEFYLLHIQNEFPQSKPQPAAQRADRARGRTLKRTILAAVKATPALTRRRA